MEHLENTALALIEVSISYAERQDPPLTDDDIKKYLRSEQFQGVVASVLSETENLTEQNIESYNESIKDMGEQANIMEDLSKIPNEVFVEENKKQVVFHSIVSTLAAYFSKLSCDSFGYYLNLLASPNFQKELLFPLRYPGSYAKINECFGAKETSFLPESDREEVESVKKEKGIVASMQKREKLLIERVSAREIPEESTKSIDLLNMLCGHILHHDKLLAIAENKLSDIPKVFSEEQLGQFLQGAKRYMGERPSLMIEYIQKYIASAEEQLEGALVENHTEEVDNDTQPSHTTPRP